LANLGKTKEGWYYEKRNYGIWETQEPGSTFKLPAIVAALEDKVVDTATVFDSEGGRVSYYDRVVRDSDVNGYGKISAGRAFEVSSNTVFSKMKIGRASCREIVWIYEIAVTCEDKSRGASWDK